MATSNGVIDGATLLAQLLVKFGVETIFCITGAGNLAVVNAINKYTDIEVVFSHHEQAAVMEAQGYSRVTNKPGVVLVTTGGGVANTITGVLSAQLDSVPIFLISGNESSFHCMNMHDFRAYGVQGFDSVAVLKPITKLAIRVASTEEIMPKFIDAWESMISLRNGPVHFDFPMDLQRAKIKLDFNLDTLEIRANDHPRVESAEINNLLFDLSASKKPLFYIGNGARNPETKRRILEFVERYNIPFALSWSAIDLFDHNHPLNIGRIGIYGDRHSNLILQQCDLFVSLGSRLAIPQVGYDKNDFGRNAKKYVIDIDSLELTKFDGPNWVPILSGAENFITELLRATGEEFVMSETSKWLSTISYIKNAFPLKDQIGENIVEGSGFIHSFDVIDVLSNKLPKNATIVTDVGAALLTGHYAFRISEGQRFFTSQGLGEMGFGLPGALGAYFGDKSRPIICLNTDGAIMFNLQEMEVAKQHSIPLKLFIFNNLGYAMIKISQSNLFESNFVGSDINSGISFPNFADIAKTFDFNYNIISSRTEAEKSIPKILSSKTAELIDVRMNPNQKYFPRLATSKLADGSLISPPLEDLDPKISLEDLEKHLNSLPTDASKRARS
jgi:acetolactate synthase I/II/III large subunit